jgi:hypothetical protein
MTDDTKKIHCASAGAEALRVKFKQHPHNEPLDKATFVLPPNRKWGGVCRRHPWLQGLRQMNNHCPACRNEAVKNYLARVRLSKRTEREQAAV